MPRLLLFCSLILATPLNFAQHNPAPAVELFFITENAPSSPIITCTLTAQSQCWGNILGIYPPNPEDYFLTEDYDEETYTPSSNNLGSASAGFDFITSNNTLYPTFAYGLYKITSNGTDKYFYLDYRDYRIGFYGYYNPPTTGNDIDLWIKYRYDLDRFEYNTYGYAIGVYVPIESGQVLNFWDIKQKGQQLTAYFPDYWENCLAVIKDENNHPMLVWGPYNGFSKGQLSYYKIEKNITSCDPTWYQYDQTINTFYEDVAENYCTLQPPAFCEGGCSVGYRIKAVDDQGNNSDYSNEAIAYVIGHMPYKIVMDNSKLNKNKDYLLKQNYPNPFNPVTVISWYLPVDNFITLKVFDVMGREVSTLVNAYMKVGDHSIEFNGSHFCSGIYFYRIQAGNFNEIRKFVLLK